MHIIEWNACSTESIGAAAELIRESRRPLLVAGGSGVHYRDAAVALPKPRLTEAEWRQFVAGGRHFTAAAASEEMKVVYHHHGHRSPG